MNAKSAIYRLITLPLFLKHCLGICTAKTDTDSAEPSWYLTHDCEPQAAVVINDHGGEKEGGRAQVNASPTRLTTRAQEPQPA